MNSCKNWHCCCHTIIPKKRRVVMQYRPPIKIDFEEDNIATKRKAQLKKKIIEEKEALNHIESRQINGADSSSDRSENSDSEFNESAQSGGGSLTNGSELTDIIPKSHAENSESTTSKDETDPPSETKSDSVSVDQAIDDKDKVSNNVEEIDVIKSKKAEEVKTDSIKADVTKENITVNGSVNPEKSEKSLAKEIVESEDKPKIEPKVEISTPLPKPTPSPEITKGTKRALSEVVVVKDKEQPSTSTGASTGRYNCRNRDKFHKCLKCGKMFFQLDTFVRHEKEHLLEETKPCHCNICNRSYTSQSSFARHLKTHATCTQCSKIFSQSEVGKMSADGNYYCSECKKNNASPHPPVLQPEGQIKQSEPVVKPLKMPGENVDPLPQPALKNGAPVFARKSVPVFIPRKNEPVEPPVKKVKTLGAGLQPTVVKNSSSFLRCGKCDKRFPNLTTLKNHQTLHTLI